MAAEVARQLMSHDSLGAHARDELGINAIIGAKPVQAAVASGAALPLAAGMVVPERLMLVVLAATSLLYLMLLGVISAKVGGAPVARAATRVVAWGALGLLVTASVGALFGIAAKVDLWRRHLRRAFGGKPSDPRRRLD